MTEETPIASQDVKPVAWMYDYPGNNDPRFQSYEGMSCIEEDQGMIETPLYSADAIAAKDSEIARLKAKNGQLQEAVSRSLLAGKNLHDKLVSLEDTFEPLDTEDQAVVAGALDDLIFARRTLEGFSA